LLVIPLHNTYITPPIRQIIAGEHEVSVPGSSWVTTWSRSCGAGFYSSVSGPLPFAFGRVPPEEVMIYELKAPSAP
jgi:hypothetical protein